jgi:hypothetical protein
MKKNLSSILLIGALSALLVFIGALIYSKVNQEDNIINIENNTLSKFNDPKNKPVPDSELNAKVLYFEEKYNSVNKRFDDLYILGSIIVLLLITINLGVFVNTKNRVDEYLKDNFASHQKQVEDYAKAAGIAYGQIETLRDAAQKSVTTLNQQSIPK